jgi:hypothetical protein
MKTLDKSPRPGFMLVKTGDLLAFKRNPDNKKQTKKAVRIGI